MGVQQPCSALNRLGFAGHRRPRRAFRHPPPQSGAPKRLLRARSGPGRGTARTTGDMGFAHTQLPPIGVETDRCLGRVINQSPHRLRMQLH